jgi:CHAT domain-containing protein/tetratricopeptide (TPR) repeat protein
METNKQQLHKAIEQYTQGNYPNCLSLLTTIMPLYLQTEDWENYAQALHYILECKYQTTDYNEALILWQQTLPIVQTHCPPQTPIWVELYSVAGNIYGMLGNSNEQIKYYQLALASASEQDKPSLYNNIGWVYLNNKDYTKALDYLLLAYTIFTQQNNQTAKLSVINLIAASFRHLNKLPKALEYYLEAKEIAQKLPQNKNVRILSDLYQNTAKCYFELKDYNLALTHYQTALNYYEQIPQKSKAAIYHNLGDIHKQQGQLKQAENYYTQALHEAQRVDGNKHANTAHQYRTLAAFYTQQNSYPKALQFYQDAICCVCSSFNNPSPQINPKLTDVLWHYRLLEAIAGKANIFEQLSQEQKDPQNSFDNLQYALDAYLLADQLIDYLRRNFEAEGSKLNFAQYAAKVYAQALNTTIALHQRQHPTALDSAFMFSEKAKAMVLLEKIEDSKAKITAQIPQELLDQEQRLLQQITHLNHKIQQQPTELHLRNAYFDVQQQHEQLIAQFKNDYPKYYQLQHDIQTVTITQLQQLLQGKQTAIITYCLTDTDLHIWVIAPQNRYVVSQPKPDLQNLCKQWQKAVKTMNLKQYVTTSVALYNCLIKPIEQHLKNTKELVIIPEAELLYLPFQALLSNNLPEKCNYSNLPYLLHCYAIGYHYSATLLYNQSYTSTQSNVIENNTYSYLGIAPVLYGNVEAMKDLPDAQLEVDEVAQLFTAQRKTAHTTLYHDASLAQFKQMAKQYRYLLLSTHACYDNNAAEQTRILFSPFSQPNILHPKQTDYCLFVNDAYNLQLQANLVVLSACESGLGELINGEGIMGINRGFMYAGASNLVFTLEKVPARYARLLIVELFKQILLGKNYRQALQIAQISLVNATQPPLNWAFFSLICQI